MYETSEQKVRGGDSFSREAGGGGGGGGSLSRARAEYENGHPEK